MADHEKTLLRTQSGPILWYGTLPALNPRHGRGLTCIFFESCCSAAFASLYRAACALAVERAASFACRKVGASVSVNVMVHELNLAAPGVQNARRPEIVAIFF